MKRILLSLITILGVSAAIAGSTRAYFNDEATVAGNSFVAGTLDIQDASESWMVPVTLNNFKPGDSFKKWVVINNAGTLDTGSLVVSAVNKNDPNNLLANINVAVYGQVEGFDQGIYSPNWAVGQPVSNWLTDVNILGTAVYKDATAAHVLASGKKDTIILDFKVPTTLGNEFQGKSATFDLKFVAEQVH